MTAALQELPLCSLVVPSYRRPAQLSGCLAALAELDYPGERLEVIVVDDGGDIPLDPVVRRFEGTLDVRLLRVTHGGQARARNLAAREARGELLAFTDDDCRPTRSWLRLLAERYLADPGNAYGGHTVNILADNAYAATSQLVLDLGYAQQNVDRTSAHFFTSNNLVVPAGGFRTVEGFDERFRTSEDRDFCDRWIAAGMTLTYVPEAIVLHAHPLTLKRFVRQHFQYGRGAFLFHRARSRRWSQPVRIDPGFHFKVMTHPLRTETGRRAAKLTLLLQVWNLANTAGFLWEWAHSRGGPAASAARGSDASPVEPVAPRRDPLPK